MALGMVVNQVYASSDTLGVTLTPWVIILEVVHLKVFFPLSLKDLIIIRIFISPLLLSYSLLLLSVHGIFHLNLSKLIQRHGREIMTRLEHLLLILLAKAHAVINILILHSDSLNFLLCTIWIFILIHYITTRLSILRGTSSSRHHIW